MGDGNKIIITIGNLPFVPGSHDRGDDEHSPEETPRGPHPRENGSNIYNRHWNNNSASDLRNALFALLTGDGENSGRSTAAQPDVSTSSTNTNNSTNSTSFNFTNGQTAGTSRQGQESLVNQTLEKLINLVQQNDNFPEFRNQPPEFWDHVKQMSDISVVEKYVKGNLEPQAFSRYGELLDQFTRQGGQLNTFLTSLPPNEREVFQARYFLNQTFGADELFVGRGIAIDKSGQFVVREFLANNGRQLETPLNTVLGFLGGKLSESTAASLFANGQLLLNAKTAALLSLSLALYQNINAKLALTEALPEVNPQSLLGKANENGGMRYVENGLEAAKVSVERRAGENLIAAALINGALVVIDERGKTTRVGRDTWAGGEAVLGNVFSAGAMGAMFGAVVGCVVPLAETNIGMALGFAASVVVGTSERGLRSLSANLLISDVVTNGVQKFLSAAANILPAEKIDARDLLKQRLFANRTLAYLAS